MRRTGALGIVSGDAPALTVEQPVLVSSSGYLNVGDNVSLTVTNATGFDLQVQSGATVVLAGQSTLHPITFVAGSRV